MDRDVFFFSKIKVKNIIHDTSEKLNSLTTVVMLVIAATAVAYKTYVISPIECYSATTPSGNNFDKYLSNYCWVKGTVVLQPDHTPTNDNEWNSLTRIMYYPWIPIILLFQALMFYIPFGIWKEFCSSKSGDLCSLMKDVVKVRKSSSASEYNGKLQYICDEIEGILYLSRDFRYNFLSKIKRRLHRRLKFICGSKRQGTRLVIFYLIIKLLSIANCIFQIYLMINFLNIKKDFFFIYRSVLSHIFYGTEWPESPFFPRITFCRVTDVRVLGITENSYIAQCVLPINILNEKLYVFLFLWVALLLFVSVYYLIVFIFTILIRSTRVRNVKDCLKLKNVYTKHESFLMEKFVDNFLRWDGYMLLKIARFNAGEVVFADIVLKLWQIFKEKYRQINFNNDTLHDRQSLSLKLEPMEAVTSLKYRNPSAPAKEGFM